MKWHEKNTSKTGVESAVSKQEPARDGRCQSASALGGSPGSLVAQMTKNLPVMQETLVQSLGGEDPLEEGMATPSNTPAWRIPWTEEPGGATAHGVTESRTQLHAHI